MDQKDYCQKHYHRGHGKRTEGTVINKSKNIVQCPPLASVSSVVVLFSVVVLLILSISVGHALQGVPGAPSDVPLDVVKVLRQIKAADKDLLAVSEEDGRFLRVMVATSGAKRALEIGAADG